LDEHTLPGTQLTGEKMMTTENWFRFQDRQLQEEFYSTGQSSSSGMQLLKHVIGATPSRFVIIPLY